MSEKIENRLFDLFTEKFRKFYFEFNSRKPYIVGFVSEHFVDNDSSTTNISFSEQDMRHAWFYHVRELGCNFTYVPSSKRNINSDNIYVMDPSEHMTNGRYIEIGKDVAIKILALGYIP